VQQTTAVESKNQKEESRFSLDPIFIFLPAVFTFREIKPVSRFNVYFVRCDASSSHFGAETRDTHKM
jgi:hypothetical protein